MGEAEDLMFSPVAEMIGRGMNSNYYVRTFATRHEALAHAVEKNVEADAPLAYLAVHGLEDDYAVVDAETGARTR